MTLSERNTIFKVGIWFCAIMTLIIIALSFLLIPTYSAIEENTQRSGTFFKFITGRLFNTDYLAVHTSIALAVVFSLISILLIRSFFESTSAAEIFYFFIFIISLSFELIRLTLPLYLIRSFPLFYLNVAARVILFVRFSAIFSLLAASICAAGLEIQRVRIVIFVIIIAALIMSIGVPVDTLAWDTCFNLTIGYTSMYTMVEVIVSIATIISFLVAVKVRKVNGYLYVSIGVTAALIGRNILFGADNWVGSIVSILLLSFGTWFMCSRLHKIHLWL